MQEKTGYEIALWAGTKLDERIVLTAGSLGELRQVIVDWARSLAVSFFSLAPPDAQPKQRNLMRYSNEATIAARTAQRAEAVRRPRDDIFDIDIEPDLRIGWYLSTPHSSETYLGDADVLARHLLRAGWVRTTADYEDLLAVGGSLQAQLVRTVHTVEQADVNSYLARGWRIIAMDYDGGVDEAGLLVGRKTMFVLGHPEPDAI